MFADIFTVYKGRTVQDFKNHRINADPQRDGFFYKEQVMPAVLEWLGRLVDERCDAQIVWLLRAMFSFKPERRPSAETVWRELNRCTSMTTLEPTYFCGPCCMPMLHDDPLLMENNTKPALTKYASSFQASNAEPLRTDPFFETRYPNSVHLDLRWIRNLRHWNRSLLDVVQPAGKNLLARKRIFSPEDNEDSFVAKHEAEILGKVSHRHIVGLKGTYVLGQVYTLLFEPAADYDLRTFLALAEIYEHDQAKSPMNLDFLTRAFGCLADALATVHAKEYDHGDISPENILVHNNRLYLSKFSFGLKTHSWNRAPNNQRPYRFLDMLGKISLTQGTSQEAANSDRQPRQKVSGPCSSSIQLHS